MTGNVVCGMPVPTCYACRMELPSASWKAELLITNYKESLPMKGLMSIGDLASKDVC